MTTASSASEAERSPRPASAGSGRGAGRPGRGARIATYIRQVVAELRKVIWPTRNELVTYTVVSITFVAAMIAFVGVLDFGFAKLIFALFG